MGKNTKKIDYTKTLAAKKPRKIGKSGKKPARPRMMAIQNKPVPKRGPRNIKPLMQVKAAQYSYQKALRPLEDFIYRKIHQRTGYK